VTPATRNVSHLIRRYTWRARFYWTGLIFVVAASLFAVLVNAYVNRDAETPPWLLPLDIIVCLLLIGIILATEARKRNLRSIIRMLRARKATSANAPEVTASVARLSELAGTPLPMVYLTDVSGPSLFSAGWSPRRSAIFLDLQAVRGLDRKELDAVVAHELSHIRHYDGLSRTILMYSVGVAVTVGCLFVQSILHGTPPGKKRSALGFVRSLLLFVLVPFIIPWVWVVGILLKHMLAEQEYRSDMESVRLTGNCVPLASALGKLTTESHEWEGGTDGLLYLADIIGPPFREGALERLFDVHPRLSGRLERLLRLHNASANSNVAEQGSDRVARAGVDSFRTPRRDIREVLWIVGILAFCIALDWLLIWFVSS